MDAGSTADLRNRRSPVRRGFAKPVVAIRSICVARYASSQLTWRPLEEIAIQSFWVTPVLRWIRD
jgi:hypothetical protein